MVIRHDLACMCPVACSSFLLAKSQISMSKPQFFMAMVTLSVCQIKIPSLHCQTPKSSFSDTLIRHYPSWTSFCASQNSLKSKYAGTRITQGKNMVFHGFPVFLSLEPTHCVLGIPSQVPPPVNYVSWFITHEYHRYIYYRSYLLEVCLPT